jgi:hypothetical protein
MTGLRKIAIGGCIFAGLIGAGARLGTAVAAQPPAADQASKDQQKRLAAGEVEAKRLLLLMDRDKSGKVSKEEFMKFMEAEFERMDVNKDGELDVQELTHFTPHVGVRR